jgi:hypothetical protein
MDVAMVTRLEDLPAFEVQRIDDGGEPELIGVFTHLHTVRLGRSWLYAGDAGSLIGDLADIDETSRSARFIAPFWSLASPIQVGSVAPWLDAYWQAHHITMILDTEAGWLRTEFVPSPAQYFRLGKVLGCTKLGQALRADAVPTHIDETGWDHEHCELCQSKVGLGGAAYGYQDRHHRWLCERCYRDYAAPHSLGFVFDI